MYEKCMVRDVTSMHEEEFISRRWPLYFLCDSFALGHPGVFEHFGDGQPVVNVTIQHFADQIDAGF